MLLVYTYKITPRVNYIMKHIFSRMLNVDMNITTKVEDFIAHKGPKITYTRQPLQNEFFIKSNELLFEQGISDVEISIHDWDGLPCFFPTTEGSVIPYDIFSASFYLLSRYEEYLPHVKDEHGRFPVSESLAFQNDFLEIPVVDLWVKRLKVALQRRFPELEFKSNVYKQTSIMDVSVAYAYRKKGVIRTIGATLIDLFKFRLSKVLDRYLVLLGFRKDPYDFFFRINQLHKQYQCEAVFFFLMADYSNYDKNISVINSSFKTLIKSVADYSIVSLMASYKGFDDLVILKKERNRLINTINRPVKRVRQRFNRLNIPDTYRLMVDAGFNEDYTMGYTNEVGFRAGTCSPFYFYDISFEEQIPLLINSFCMQYTSLYKFKSVSKAEEKIRELSEIVQEVNGDFNVVFSNEILQLNQRNSWRDLYIKYLKMNPNYDEQAT
ncbi:polysaccharide deacetylase family protein [Galbibacter sp.]|uniref:polysaccharide deacetylase family protein n=1 Tax=Galbibacter sp. TaxID=2918471 RepID=UPI003A8D1C95